MPAFLCLRNLRYGRCLVLLFGYTLGIVLGCAITLTFDFKISRESRGGINVKRELVPLVSHLLCVLLLGGLNRSFQSNLSYHSVCTDLVYTFC